MNMPESNLTESNVKLVAAGHVNFRNYRTYPIYKCFFVLTSLLLSQIALMPMCEENTCIWHGFIYDINHQTSGSKG